MEEQKAHHQLTHSSKRVPREASPSEYTGEARSLNLASKIKQFNNRQYQSNNSSNKPLTQLSAHTGDLTFNN